MSDPRERFRREFLREWKDLTGRTPTSDHISAAIQDAEMIQKVFFPDEPGELSVREVMQLRLIKRVWFSYPAPQ